MPLDLPRAGARDLVDPLEPGRQLELGEAPTQELAERLVGRADDRGVGYRVVLGAREYAEFAVRIARG